MNTERTQSPILLLGPHVDSRTPDALEQLTLRVEERGLVMPDGVSREAGLILPPPKEIITDVEGATPQGLRRDENLAPVDISGSVLAIANPKLVLSRIVDEAVNDPDVSTILKHELSEDARDPDKLQTGYLALLESRFLFDPKHQLLEQGTKEYRYRESGKEKLLSVKIDAPLSAALDSFLRAVTEKELPERSALLRPCLQAIEQVVLGIRDEVKGQETVGYLGGLSKSLVGLLETVDSASRAVVLRTVSLMDFSPAVAEELMWHLDRTESLDTPLAMRSYAVLLGETGTESAFVREQERRIGDLVRRIEELSPQERYDEFVILSQESKRIVMCPPSEFGRKLGLEVEWLPIAAQRFLAPVWISDEDTPNLEVKRNSQTLEYTPQYIKDVVLLESWMQTHALGVSSLHLHIDREEKSLPPKIGALIDNQSGGPLRENELHTWEVRGLMPPLFMTDDKRALISGCGTIHVANLLIEGEISSSEGRTPVPPRIQGAIPSVRHLVWGMALDGTFTPRELAQLLKCLPHQEMFASVDPVTVAANFNLSDMPTLMSLHSLFSSWSGFAKHGAKIEFEILDANERLSEINRNYLSRMSLVWLRNKGKRLVPSAKSYIGSALKSGNSELTTAAFQALRNSPEIIRDFGDVLVDFLSSNYDLWREEAAQALRLSPLALQDQSEKLLRLLQSKDPELRIRACEALKGSAELVFQYKADISELLNISHERLQCAALETLAISPDAVEVHSAEVARLLSSSNPILRLGACQCLHSSAHAVKAQAKELFFLLLNDSVRMNKTTARMTLSTVPEALRAFGPELLDGLTGRNALGQGSGLFLLSFCPEVVGEQFERLMRLLIDSDNPLVRDQAANLLILNPELVMERRPKFPPVSAWSHATTIQVMSICPEIVKEHSAELLALINDSNYTLSSAASLALRSSP